MMGWQIIISQQSPTEWRAPDTAKNSIELASWKATFGGVTWIEELTKAGKTSPLKGYPNTHLAFTPDILPLVQSGIPPHDDLAKKMDRSRQLVGTGTEQFTEKESVCVLHRQFSPFPFLTLITSGIDNGKFEHRNKSTPNNP